MNDFDVGAIFGDRFEEVYDHDGESIFTNCCGVYMMWDPVTELYFCPQCGRTITRRIFLNKYVRPYGPECYSCRTNFPQCVVCHKNHQQELDDHEFS